MAAGTIVLVQSGFDRVATAEISNDGGDAGKIPTHIVAAGSVIGCGVVLPPAPYGMRICSAESSIDSMMDFPRGIRLAIVSLANGGAAATLQGIIAQFNVLVGAYGAEQVLGSGIFSGAYVPDLQNGNVQANSGLGTTGAQGFPINVHADEFSDVLSSINNAGASGTPVPQGSSGIRRSWGEGRGAIQIPANTAAAALFIAYRPYSGAAPAAPLVGATIRGAVHGYALTQNDLGANQEHTPARTGNVILKGPLTP